MLDNRSWKIVAMEGNELSVAIVLVLNEYDNKQDNYGSSEGSLI